MVDPRKKFLINITCSNLGFFIEEQTWEKDILTVHLLEDFLDNTSNVLLCARLEIKDDNKRIHFSKVINNGSRNVIFFKNNQDTINEQNLLDTVSVITVQGSLNSSLYNILNRVYTPFINQNAGNVDNSNIIIEKHLVGLQASLRSKLLSADSDEDPLDNVNADSLSVIMSIDQEVEYWDNVAKSTKHSRDRKICGASFRDILVPLARDFSVAESIPISDIEDTLENAHNILDDLWRHEPPFPKARIEHLMELIAYNICNYIKKQFNNTNIWSQEYAEALELLEQCILIGNKWLGSCRELTQIFWPNYSIHMWKGEPFVPETLSNLVKRLQDISKTRLVHRQLTRLLNSNEQDDLQTNEMFAPFNGLNVLQCGPYVEPVWVSATKQFELLLQPAEQRVASKLKTQISSMDANTRQLLHEFSRYSELICRPIMKNTLKNERQYLLSLLKDYVRSLANQMNDTPQLSTKYDTPQIVAEILGTRQIKAKATEVISISEKILDDLSGYEDLNNDTRDLLRDLKQQHNELYDSWTSEIVAQIKNKSLSLCESDPVVQFTSDKLMRVNYSARLVKLISEVRQLTALGYNVPDLIVQTSTHAKQFMQCAKYLEQIANFHNTIGDMMIPSQRPMMLASALELSRLVQEQEVVSWGEIKSVEVYVNHLKVAVDKLSKENDLLTSYHEQILDKISLLSDIDLIKNYDKWKSEARAIRDVMGLVQQKGFKSMQNWRMDIDRHLSKALESQYVRCLDRVHLHLAEIHTDLIYRDNRLLYYPDEKALKEKYELQMKRFVEIPKNFRGVSEGESGQENVYSNIIERCKEKLSEVSSNTDNLLEQLEGVKKHWGGWLTLGSLDPAQLVTWQHWDLHFRASKTFGQEIAKLPSVEERVGCFIVNLSRLRSDLESHNRSYWDQLISTLKDSIVKDVVKLQQYVNTSTATLNRQPLTMEQIGEADASHSVILTQKPEMELAYQELMQKANILSTWTRERIDSVNRLQGGWERLQNLLENYQLIIAKQMENVKASLIIESENFVTEMERFGAKWEQVKPRPNSGQIANETLVELNKHLENIKEKRAQWDQIREKQDKIFGDYEKFGMEPPKFELYSEIESDLLKEESIWTTFEDFYEEFESISNEEWILFRKKIYRFEDFLAKSQAELEKLEMTPLITRLLQEIHKYQATAPILKYLKGDDFIEKHWMEVYALLNMDPKHLDALCLRDFLNVSEQVVSKQNELQRICKKAASEVIVRQALAELEQWDVQAKFQLNVHLDSKHKEIALIKDFKDILNKIGDNQSLLQSVKNSADYDSFSERASVWENRLSDLDHHLTSLAQIQRKWIYLEPIFSGGTLTQEKSRFDRIDKDFKNVMKFIENDPRVCSLTRFHNLRSILESLQEQLCRCQKSLDDFLAGKRNRFPRFLFLGDDDLLEVVGQSSKEQVIQSHLKKLFAGINNITLDESGKYITTMNSAQGEVVVLSNQIDINQPVEDWLNNLVKEMQATMKDLLMACLSEGSSPDPLKYPSQILCLADSINFASKCEQAIGSMSLNQLLNNYKTQLVHYSSLNFNESRSNDSNSLDSSDEDANILDVKLKALLLDTIHHISVIELLIEENVTKITDWSWQKQLRFYANSTGQVTIKMVNARIEYAYEYIGNVQKLVRTPLTDQCFLTLTQAMHLGMGGNPYGPAGTGKTESVKALGNLLGRQVLVFNCDEGVDAASMGRILSGLVRCGAWGCFDEFNRLDEATLSAVSMHIQPIQNALRTNKSTINLLDQEIQVNKHCGIFVTLNPAGGGYGGRNKLPDNLKQLFRPVVMTHPDHELIATTLLHCCGYRQADVIGRKLVEIFSMASKLLSKQQHYDWGLRALRTVLNGCENALRTQYKESEITTSVEMDLVVKCIRTDTLSKLTFYDSEIFDGLIKDIFPGAKMKESNDDRLLQALQASFADLGLEINNRQINKAIELYEQLKQRMGVAIVGPPCSGKSTVRNLLFSTLGKLGRIIKQHVFNPKSMPRQQLLGYIDTDTRQWTDGLLTLYSLEATNEPPEVWSHIVCDGDVDPEWVESLNSVLDDNRLLSLPSGWRIQFGQNVNFIFETHDLGFASPATISRMGVVFLSEEDVDVSHFVDKFVKRQPEDIQSVLNNYIHDYLYRALDWVMKQADLVVNRSKIPLLRTCLSMMMNCTTKQEFIINMLNGFGGQLNHDFREIFAQQVFDWTGETAPAIVSKARYNSERGTIDSYFTNPNQTIDTFDGHIPLILTGQVNQTIDAISHWLENRSEEHFLLVGPHGSAKRLILEHVVKDRYDTEIAAVHCSAHVTPQSVIHKIIQHCMVISSSKGRVYKPKKGGLVLYFKNLHLLKEDRWGTNMLLSFLQQMITYKGFFDNSLEWVSFENIIIVGSMAQTNQLCDRFTSLVHIYAIDLPNQEDTSVIFNTHLTSIVKQSLPNSSIWSRGKVNKLTHMMISIYNEMNESFSTMNQQHYNFSPHDLTKWCDGIVRYKVQNGDMETFLLEVCCHEALRIFYDKLVSDEDKGRFKDIVDRNILKDFSKNDILRNALSSYFVATTQFNMNKSFVPLTKLNADDWTTIIRKGRIQYEREGHSLNIQIIPELLDLTEFLSKTLTVREGHCLLIGTAGAGRKSGVKIISALESAKLIVPVSSTEPFFKNDLKTAMQCAGVDGDQVYVLLEDHIFNKESVMNTLNVFLSSSEIPGLYKKAELESLLASLKDDATRENADESLYEVFTQNIQRRLHLIVCLDSTNKHLPKILESCPALLERCSVRLVNEWTADTIDTFPSLLINSANENVKEENNRIASIKSFATIYNLIDQKCTTPLNYINMIDLYINIYTSKRDDILSKKKKLDAGVRKLTEAQEVVDDLKRKAAVQQEKLAEKQDKANKALDMISNTMKNANVHKDEMEALKKHTEQENILLKKRKEEIEIELSEVEPLIQEARSAVGNIKTESLSEIRSLRAPPEIIRDILEGVLRLMGIQDTSWNSMKIFLAKRGVKEEIRSFNANKITSDSRQSVEKLINNKKDSFDPKSSKRASVAAAPLAAWVLANVRYSRVLEKIKPLEREQNRLLNNLSEAESQLSELSAGLQDVDATVAKLKIQLATYTREAAEVEIQLNAAQQTLASAEGLISKLTDEYKRWLNQLKELDDNFKTLPTNCLLAAGFITYLSREPEDVRTSTMNSWIEAIMPDFQFNLEGCMSSEREQIQWQSEGLSTDTLSIQNSVIIQNSKLCSFLIDPTSMATNWIKNKYKNSSFESITTDSPKFCTTLELAVRFGKILLIEEMETIPPILFALLRKQFIQQSERLLVSLNGKLVDYSKEFRLVMSSRNAFTDIPVYITPYLNIVNFTTTRAGLAEQLLINAIKQESPQLEERRKELLRKREEMQEKLYDLQNRLLEDLANATGDILQNKSLLTSLNETKASSTEIASALQESYSLQEKLNTEYDIYREISSFGSLLYFAALEFAASNVLYSLSVSAFTTLFLKSLPSTQELQNSNNYGHKIVIQALYQYMSRGLFKDDRIKFLLHLTHKLFPEQIPNEEWNFFIGNTITTRRDSITDRAALNWIPEQALQLTNLLQSNLPNFYNNLKLNNEEVWKEFMASSKCEANFPKTITISEFQKILIVKVLRGDRLYSTMNQCVLHLTGIKYLHFDSPQLSQIYKESNNLQPILMIITPGNDPSIEVRDLAEKIVKSENYVEVSMGEGQETKAILSLIEAAQVGQWIILKNLHLVTSWLPILCQQLQTLKPHENFRLWLITEAKETFNSVLSENSLKIAYEAPVGIKSNLQKIYANFGQVFVEKLNNTAARIFFILACIHAILQERRNYIPQGWSEWHEFGDVDLSTMVKLAEEIWQMPSNQVPWKYLIGWSAEAIYGGRIKDKQDLYILYSYLKQYLSEEVLSHRWRPFGIPTSLPSTNSYQDYLNFVTNIANNDIPSYFGLPENVGRAFERNNSSEVMSYLKNMLIIKNLNIAPTKEALQRGLSPYITLWKKLNHGQELVRMPTPDVEISSNSIRTFIATEFKDCLTLIQGIHKNFMTLNKMVKGGTTNDKTDLDIATSLLNFKTPNSWLKSWNGPVEPSKYLRDVINRAIYLENLQQEQDILHKPLNLSFFFNPETFLAAFKQDYARRKQIPLDQLELKGVWKSSEDACAITGLLIEGALFDGLNLLPCVANSESITTSPNCYIIWKENKQTIAADKSISVPLYYTSSREKQLAILQVPCSNQERNKWIQAALAFFLEY